MQPIHRFFALVLALAFLTQAPAVAADAASQARALFDDYWEFTLREYPEFATFIGDARYADRLNDVSDAAVRARNAAYARFAQRAADIDASQLPASERVSLRV
ncbi:MAG TPA: hypothetical protein VF291_03915, partial [Burkholderiaceae bacterium]